MGFLAQPTYSALNLNLILLVKTLHPQKKVYIPLSLVRASNLSRSFYHFSREERKTKKIEGIKNKQNMDGGKEETFTFTLSIVCASQDKCEERSISKIDSRELLSDGYYGCVVGAAA